MKVVLILVVIAFLYWYYPLRHGKLSFWRVVVSNPDMAYDFFMSNECWKVFKGKLPENYDIQVPSSEWAGPSSLNVPKLWNQTIKIYGKLGYCEKS